MLAAALVSPVLARVDTGIAGSILSTIMAQYKIPENYPGRNKNDISKHIFQGGECNSRIHRKYSAAMSRR